MHIVIMTLYGFTVWLSAMAFSLITGAFSLLHTALSGPLVISTAVLLLALLDAAGAAIMRRVRRLAARGRVAQ